MLSSDVARDGIGGMEESDSADMASNGPVFGVPQAIVAGPGTMIVTMQAETGDEGVNLNLGSLLNG
jgi:hypothetical protein